MRLALSTLALAALTAFGGCRAPEAPESALHSDAGPDSVLVSLLVEEGDDATVTPRVLMQKGTNALFATDHDGQVELSVSAVTSNDAAGTAQHLIELRYTRGGELISNPRMIVADNRTARIELGDGDHALAFEVLLRNVDTAN